MSVATKLTLRDPDHFVVYANAQGATVTAPRDLILNVYAPDAPGTYPVIIYSHGHTGSGEITGGAGRTAAALADLGYIVIAPNHLDSLRNYPTFFTNQFAPGLNGSSLHRAADVQFALDQAGAAIAGLLGYAADLSAPVVAGHSHGAFTAAFVVGLTLGEAPATLRPGNIYGLTTVVDGRFKAAALLSPQGEDSIFFGIDGRSWDAITVPVLTITGTLDSEASQMDWRGRLDPFDNGDAAGWNALVYRDADHGDIGGDLAIPGLLTSITGFIDLFIDGRVKGDSAALAKLNSLDAVMADPLLQEAYVRTAANTPGQGQLTGDARADLLDGLITADLIRGGEGGDTLNGGGSADTLFGEGGLDRLNGGDGDDVLGGNGGWDVLHGGPGSDRFLIFSAADSDRFNADIVLDFAQGFDRLDLGFIDANTTAAGDQAFRWVGFSQAATGAGTLRIGFVEDVGIYIYGHTDADDLADLMINIGTFAIGPGDMIL